MTAERISERNVFIGQTRFQGSDDDINGFDADERNDDAAEAVNQQVALQDGERAEGFVSARRATPAESARR